MTYESTRAQDIYRHLKDKGFRVFFPEQHTGECTEPYVVVKTGVTTQVVSYSSTVTYYKLLCYIPKDTPSKVDEFLEQVKSSMEGLYPMIKPVHRETETFYDNSVKGYMRSVEYSNYRKFTH